MTLKPNATAAKLECRILLAQIRACRLCEPELPLGARPVLQLAPTARILIAAQAPGRRVHASGKPFSDASGERLRAWLGVTPQSFYDTRRFAIVPMGFCYPGAGSAGDLPPRPECARHWREKTLAQLRQVELAVVIGRYAQRYHLDDPGSSVTEAVRQWRSLWPAVVPLPHPSPRNRVWLKRNPWFESELLPALKQRVARILGRRC